MNASGLVPVEFYVVVELDPVAEKTAGGVWVPDSVQAKDKISAQEGTIIAASPLAFTYEEWPEGSRKPQVGDRILFKRYDGHLHEANGKAFKLLNDKSIIAIVEPEAADKEAQADKFLREIAEA